jgi:hypothetical protein
VSKKSATDIKPDVQSSDNDVIQTMITTPVKIKIADQELEGSDLFSFFTANIIKEEKVFTR